MKNLLPLFLLLLLAASCKKSDDKCWVFTTKKTTSVSPAASGYPKTGASYQEQCNLSESDADKVCALGASKTSTTVNGQTVTVEISIIKQPRN